MKRKLFIFDTTLRDGEQAPGFSMNINEKLEIAQQLELLGVDIIEAGFPIASQGDFDAVQTIAKTIRNSTIAALCRTRFKDIDCAWEAIKDARRPRIHTFIATSEIHMKYKLNMSHNEVLQSIKEGVQRARGYTEDVEFSAEDASRSTLDFLFEVVKTAVRAGATTVNLPDTVGYATPGEYGKMFAEIRKNVPEADNIRLSSHTHDDLGLGVANSLAALENGADQIECTINGIGERAGNAALEEVVMAITTRPQIYNVSHNIITEELVPTSNKLSSIVHIEVPPNKAIVGKNAFAHEAGIHQDGILKNSLTYEIMTPRSVGAGQNKLVLGKHSGRHAVLDRARKLGFQLTREQLEKVYEETIALADLKKEVNDEDLKLILIKGNLKTETVNAIT
jgi:2-isopropylmalate synthase